MRAIPIKRCEACGDTHDLTKHHVYPTYLREIWQRKVKQKMARLCRVCHNVVHYRGGRRAARHAGHYEYVRRFCNPRLAKVIGAYRKIIKELERESRALHIGELL